MVQRYFIDSPVDSDRLSLADREAHHLIHVMRGEVGQEVLLFDGQGNEFTAQIEAVKKNTVDLVIHHQEAVTRELPGRLIAAVALPKGDRQKWLVEKLVELGVTSLVPLVTQRGVAQPVPQALARLKRSVIEASKQCGRNQLMQVESPQTVAECIDRNTTSNHCLVAHLLDQENTPSLDHHCPAQPHETVILAVGPEGGWTSDEVQQFEDSGWKVISLGRRVLRIETAALALVAR